MIRRVPEASAGRPDRVLLDPVMRAVYDEAARAALALLPVLILGETGVGKDVLAHAIHRGSPRGKRALLALHCAALSETLLESELFGHERGAFTDAYRTREGKFEVADGGTIFLDEIGELPVHLQVKLLRFLQDHIIERIGGREPLRVDVRVVAATNRDLQAAIAAGTFREDLFYRLSVLTIQVPPLRERGDDVRILAEYFLDFYAKHYKRRIKGFTQSSLRAIQSHAWPGNVRELENRIQRSVIMARDAYLRPEDLELAEIEGDSPRTLQEARDAAERAVLIEALTRNAGNITRAARDIDVSRPTLHDLLRRHGIEADRFRRPGAPGQDEVEDGEEPAP